jgi:glutathione S-transferase
MSGLKAFKLYAYGASPNPWKVAIILEELGLPYEFVMLPSIADAKKPEYTSLNPNGRVPALIDTNKENLVLWEVGSHVSISALDCSLNLADTCLKISKSGAIIDYLIAEYDPEHTLQYSTFREKYVTRCWEHFQMSGQGPYFGQAAWFSKYHSEKLPSAIERYFKEIERVLGVVDGHLEKQGTDYLVGDKITYADLMWVPYFHILKMIVPDLDLSQWKSWGAWMERLCSRPATSRVLEKQREVQMQQMQTR